MTTLAEQVTLVELVDRVLHKGVVIARVLLASVATLEEER
jgi:hypothetical protein